MDEQDWYEKNLSDFDDIQSADEEYAAEEQLVRCKQKRYSKAISPREDSYHGTDYPFDIWFLISMHIPPEDIGRFALICRKTYHVVNTVCFWIGLFRKYNKTEARRINRILAREHLSIVRNYVIRSLYQIYPLFHERLNKSDAIQKDPHFLVSSRCVRIWYSKRSTQRESFNYYFQFIFDNIHRSNQPNISIQAISPIFQVNNQYLLDKDSIVLHVISSNFVPIGPYMGMNLSQIKLNVSSDYRYHKLKLWFDSSRFCAQKSKNNTPMVTIDPVLCLRIYKWYNSPVDLD